MHVEVKFLTGLGAGQRDVIELPDGATGEQLLRAMGVRNEQRVVLIVNGRRREQDDEIHEGDFVGLMAPVGGG